MSELRQRKPVQHANNEIQPQTSNKSTDLTEEDSSDIYTSAELLPGSYWLTRIVFLRYIAFIYCVAFAVALHQNVHLIGQHGLQPLHLFLAHVSSSKDSLWDKIIRVPTLFWFIEPQHVDFWLNAVALTGIALSLVVVIMGAANMLIMLMLWLLYTSLVNVGQIWYSFGWESQLLETGFLAIFLVPASLKLSRPV
jgi:lipase maturation factor 1